ncbi:FAD-dependent monooxygenase [Noviherbaspirillum saxi]|uniref:Oxidoreductase n=1 Tax=Noviherbaspirillum saxi TaxID=2320863 RepID=A0A3A3FQN3_9BURK|nr:FAD-dependent monooxygenase [Noviherbaspirillum saxi]RJF95772.1 oxidoreductase [Noviherbaspirillum saxi]
MTAKLDTASMKVLIVGGGTGGQSCALALRRLGVDVELIDINTKWGASGAGITITGPTLRALRDLGVYDDVAAEAYVGEGIRVCDVNGNVLRELATPMPPGVGVPGSGGVTRPTLHGILARRIKAADVKIRLGITVDGLTEEADGVRVKFSDGNVGKYDLVIGADGLFSRVRELIMPDAPKPEFTGQNSWRVTVDRPASIERRTYYLGGPYKAGFTPVSATKMYMFVLDKSPQMYRPPETLHTELAIMLKDYGGEVGKVRDGLNPDSEIVYRPLEAFYLPAPWYRGRVLLVGDAAHPTTPQLASGAGMAVEDGLVLAEELSNATNVYEALFMFMRRRFERCRLVTESSLEIGRLEQARAPVEKQTAVVERALLALSEPA